MGASLIIRYLRDLFDVNTTGAAPGDVLGTTDGVNWTPVAGGGGGGGAPTNAEYLVGTADATLTNEIVVGTTPGGELGNTWASPTVDTVHSGSSHAQTQAAAEATAAAALNAHVTDPTDAHDGSAISNIPAGTIASTDVQSAINELDGQITTSLSDAVILAPASSARNVIQPTAGAVIAAIVKAHAAQSVDLTQWQDSTGTVLSHILQDGSAEFPYVGVYGSLEVYGQSPNALLFLVKATAAQTAPLYELQDSASTVLYQVGPTGTLTITPNDDSDNALILNPTGLPRADSNGWEIAIGAAPDQILMGVEDSPPGSNAFIAIGDWNDVSDLVMIETGIIRLGQTIFLEASGRLKLIPSGNLGLVLEGPWAAPPDGALGDGEVTFWYDRTDGAPKLMLKGKDIDGTPFTWTIPSGTYSPGAGAPTTATYITQTADAGLSAEQALGSLATGLLKNTTTTGVLSIGAAGTDYYAPGGTDVAVADGGTGASTAATGLSNLGGVAKTLFDANTVLAADTDDTPAAVTMGASTILARLAAGNIKAASVAEIVALLSAYVVGGTDVALADGGTGASTAAAARQNLVTPSVGTLKTGSGWYYSTSGNPGTRALTDARMFAIPLSLPACTLNIIGIEVTTLGASSAIRLGIYSDSGFLTPGALLLDAGTVVSTSTGNKEVTISQVIATSGWYWFIACSQGGTPSTVRATEAPLPFPHTTGTSAPTSTVSFSYFDNGSVAGALPANFISPPTPTFVAPKVYVRIA